MPVQSADSALVTGFGTYFFLEYLWNQNTSMEVPGSKTCIIRITLIAFKMIHNALIELKEHGYSAIGKHLININVMVVLTLLV